MGGGGALLLELWALPSPAFLGVAQDLPTFSRFGIFSGPDGKAWPGCNTPGSGFKV